MKEIDDEIKLTINTMQCDIDDGAHGELQSHLYSLLEMKRNELQQRLVERSWFEPADGIGSVVKFDQAPYKSVKLDGQVEAKPLTADELMAGGWWCADTSEECIVALVGNGVGVTSPRWDDSVHVLVCAHTPIDLHNFKQIHRIGNEFYWSEK